ncbi:cupin domain-containing protein [Candidatus Poribacteria bacterium]|nr:cupin domain-containing protein [Candidatus Poribacteria bacterium]MYK20152.1 cupin domain-containing protein [Candidatus Poribacteria bacterium]
MDWKSRWTEQYANVDALKQELQSEGFNAYEWSGRPGGAYLDYIHTQDEVVCVLSGTADVKVAEATGTVEAGDRMDVPANTYHSITVTSEEPLVVLTGMRKT